MINPLTTHHPRLITHSSSAANTAIVVTSIAVTALAVGLLAGCEMMNFVSNPHTPPSNEVIAVSAVNGLLNALTALPGLIAIGLIVTQQLNNASRGNSGGEP